MVVDALGQIARVGCFGMDKIGNSKQRENDARACD